VELMSVLERMADPPAVLLSRPQCTIQRHRASTCRLCQDACPREAVQVFTGPEIDFERCDGCGLCTAACPTGALRLTGLSMAALGEIQATVFACRHSHAATAADLILPCLGWLTADHLIWLGLSHPASTISLFHGDCTHCHSSLGRKMVGRAVLRSAGVLRAAGIAPATLVAEQRTLADNGTEHGSEKAAIAACISHLAHLAHIASTAVDEFPGMLPPAARPINLVPRRRTEWLELARELDWTGLTAPAEAMPINARRIAAGCNACGMCVHFCPSGSLTAGENGITQDATVCLSCRLCEMLCPKALITTTTDQSFELEGLGSTRRRMLACFDTRQCSACGRMHVHTRNKEQAAVCPMCHAELDLLGIA
jgi:formate hydrogenlyase subunit 6/NADH:ubiquinone oxidoreductase subunit I